MSRLTDWLTGKDLRAREHQTPLNLTRRAVTISGYDQYAGVSYGYAGRGYVTTSAIRHGTLVSGPGATDAYNEAMHGDSTNSLVNACLFRLATDFSQVPPQVVRQLDPRELDPLPDHPLTALMRRPNPHMSGLMLRWWTEYVLGVHGNAYWRKIRAGNAETGNVIELWPVSPMRMAPVTYRNSGDFISAYRYWYSPNNYEDIPTTNILHFRHGVDDADHRLGCSQLRKVAKQAATDDQVSRWMHNLLANGAQPGLVVNIDKEVTLTSQQRQEFREYMEQQFGGDNIGGLALVQGGNGIERASLSPADMDLAPLAALSESRICAIFGVPPQVVGAKVGLEHATYSNYDQAAESYTELTLLPLLTTAAETITTQLLPDFTAEADVEMRFDTSGLRALADDENELTARVVLQWDSGIVTQNEARSKLGYDPLGTEGDVFKAETVTAPEMPQEEADDDTPPKLRAVRQGRLEARTVAQDRVEALMRASREQTTGQVQGQVGTYMAGQRRRVTSKVEAESA